MVRIEVKASKKYRPEFVKSLEESIRDIVEGRVGDFEDLAKRYGVKPRKVSRT
mgnify:CR=1 FL=1